MVILSCLLIGWCCNISAVLCKDDESSVMRCVLNDAVPAEIVAMQSHMKPVIVLETLNVAW